VGEKTNTTDINLVDTRDDAQLSSWLNNASSVNSQITKTLYDNPVHLTLQTASNSRKRVVASIYLENQNDSEGDSTLYSYDLTGNVKTLVQHVKALVAADADNGKKRMDYDYDLVSGKVNKVSYQRGKGDQFFYKYSYDAENRITGALTSRDELVWTEDASYRYYLHGPLARTELGQYKVQGLDYAYTLQGWMKGINSDALSSTTEMGQDGEATTIFSKVSKDVYGFKLGYFAGDYQPISTSATAFNQRVYSAPGNTGVTGRELFNGNISYSSLALSKIGSGATTGYSYGYDQLNRLIEMRQHTVTGAWSNTNIISAYGESIAYDANGNILKYLRNGANTTGNPLDMDSLNYKYNRGSDGRLVNNRLNYVKDAVNSSNYTIDIDDQAEENYSYDKIGNLTKDNAEHLSNINWTVYGKIRNITKTGSAASQINYGYDPGGNRTLKTVQTSDGTTHTFYVRDAQGNVMGVYNQKNTDAVTWSEQDLYGSSRLGLWRWDTILPNKPPVVQSDGSPIFDSLLLGSRTYELTNHLGNVLSTISDKKIGHDNSGVVDYYIAEVLLQNDYYPFGMMMPQRKYTLTNGYRYGFNGQEISGEINNNSMTAEFWQYDGRIGRRWNLDPKPNTAISAYNCFNGNPIWFTDALGDTLGRSAGGGLVNIPNGSSIEYNGKSANGKPFNTTLVGHQNKTVSVASGSVYAFTTQDGKRYVSSFNSESGEFMGYINTSNSKDIFKEIRNVTFVFNMRMGQVNGKSMAVGVFNAVAHYKDNSYDVIYSFDARSGGHGFGPLPTGEPGENNTGKWLIKAHIWNRIQRGYYISEGKKKVGFSMELTPLFDLDCLHDPKDVIRGDFRVHPDGNTPGSAGCIALVGTVDELQVFQRSMQINFSVNRSSIVTVIPNDVPDQECQNPKFLIKSTSKGRE
jgi:hypothetical protein